MTTDEALRIIEACKDWDTGQISTIFNPGDREQENKLLDMKRKALIKAWEVIGNA